MLRMQARGLPLNDLTIHQVKLGDAGEKQTGRILIVFNDVIPNTPHYNRNSSYYEDRHALIGDYI